MKRRPIGGVTIIVFYDIATMLDEAPLSLIVAAVEEVALSRSMPPKLLWKHLFHWAKDLHSPRGVWA